MDEIEIYTEPTETPTETLLQIPKDSMLWEYIQLGCRSDDTAKIIFIAITSKVEGRVKSKGLPFGQGKSILASILAAEIYSKFDNFLGVEPYKTVQENIGYTWDQHTQSVEQANQRRKLVYIADDIQRIAGKSKSRDPYVQRWAEFYTTARPFYGVIIFTCPSIDGLAKCFRDLVNFEIKIPKEGYYEVQFIKEISNYRKAPESLKLMRYKGEGIIPRAPDWYVKWYNDWRKESSYESFIKNIKNSGIKEGKEIAIPTVRDMKKALRDAGISFDDHALLEAHQAMRGNIGDEDTQQPPSI
jgi:hypothetical protein